mgnify:CR=1 FL=1
MEVIEAKDYKKEIKIVEKYRYGEHKNCDICLTKEYCKMNPYCYGRREVDWVYKINLICEYAEKYMIYGGQYDYCWISMYWQEHICC